MKKSIFPLFSLLFLLLFIANACKMDDDTVTVPPEKDPVIENPTTFQEVINMGGAFAEPKESEISTAGASSLEVIEGVLWKCTEEVLSIEQKAGGHQGFAIYSDNANAIFAGNLLQGKSLNQGDPEAIVVNRAGGKFFNEVLTGNFASNFEVNSVTQSEVTNALQKAMGESSAVVPSNFSLSIENIQSQEQLALALGLNVNAAFTEVKNKLEYDPSSDKNQFLVRLDQHYFSTSFEFPSDIADLFDPSVSPEDLTPYVGADNPGAYISEVNYGRAFYLLFSSSSSSQEMDASLHAYLANASSDVKIYAETSALEDLEDLMVYGFARGDFIETTLDLDEDDDLEDLQEFLWNSPNIIAAEAISYSVRSLYNQQVVSTQLAANYKLQKCVSSGATDIPPYTVHWTGEVISRMGPVGAAYNTYGTDMVLISKKGDQFMRSSLGLLEGPFPIDQLGVEPCPFESIGAACNIDGNENGDFFLQIFDGTGTQFAYLNPSSGKYLEARSITELGDNDNPFVGVGIGAVAFRHKDPLGPASRYIFNKNGDKYATYLNNPNSF